MNATDALRRGYWERIAKLISARVHDEICRRERKGYRLRQIKAAERQGSGRKR